MAEIAEIKKAIENRKRSHRGIYSDVGIVLEQFSTEELYHYYLEEVMQGHDGCIRSYLENEIIAGEINRERYSP